MYDHITVNASQLMEALVTVLKAGTQAMIWGSYGVGKTSIVRQVGEALGFESVIVLTPSQEDVIDYKLPWLDEGDDGEKISRFAMSERLPRSGRHLFFVDEINTAATSLQPTLYGLMLEGVIGKYKMPKECCRIAAGNRETDKCAAQPMSAALKDRFAVHLNFVPDAENWCRWGAKNNMRPEVMAFVRDMPQVLESCNPDDPCGGCTPRSIEHLSRLLTVGIPESCESQMIQGCIGQGCGVKFAAYLDIFRNKINIDQIIRNPDSVTPPDRPDIAWSIACALAHKATKDNFANILKFAGKMSPTYSVVIVSDAIRRDIKLRGTKAYKDFAQSHCDLII